MTTRRVSNARKCVVKGLPEYSNLGVYAEARTLLMAPARWTFGSFENYQRKMLDLLGAHRLRRRLAAEDPNVAHLEKEMKVYYVLLRHGVGLGLL